MQTQPDPSLDPTAKDIVPWLGSQLEKLTKLRSFLQTRKALLKGEEPWNMQKTEIASRKWMTPWAFNIYQSSLSAIIAWTLLQLAFWLALPTVNPPTLELLFPPLAVALSLGTAAYFLSFASLLPQDRYPVQLLRARYAYLYLDGALGFWIQTLVVTVQVFWIVEPQYRIASTVWLRVSHDSSSLGATADSMRSALLLLFIASSAFQAAIMSFVIPRRLFATNGYVVHQPNGSIQAPPWRTYQAVNWLVLPLAALGVSRIYQTLDLFARVAAESAVFVIGVFGIWLRS